MEPHSNQDAIDKLNAECKLRLAPSPIHGIGVFAIRDIARGERLYADNMPVIYRLAYSQFGKLFPEVREILLERNPLITQGTLFFYPDARMVAYMNHSDTPNASTQMDTALTDIKKGEELTEDYRKIEGYTQVFPWILDK
jgi:SET domain-containing protein